MNPVLQNPDLLNVQIQGKQIGSQPTWMMCCTGPDEQSVYQHYLHCTHKLLQLPSLTQTMVHGYVFHCLEEPVFNCSYSLRRAEMAQTECTLCRALDPGSASYQCSAVMLIIKEFSRCYTKGESEESIAHRQ